MIAHEKSVVRRDWTVVEDGKWRLQLRRPAGQADHRALLRIFHQRPFAVVERQCHGVERECLERTETCCERRHPGALHHLSSVEHAFSEALLSSSFVARLNDAIAASAGLSQFMLSDGALRR